MAAGIEKALEALQNSDCAKLFGLGEIPLNPSTLLKALASGTSGYGYFLIDAVASAPGTITNAVTQPTFSYSTGPTGQLVNTGIDGVTIIINTASNTPFNSAYNTVDRAVTVLHELGHVFNLLPGAGGALIKDDQDDVAQSMANTDLLMKNCFR